MTVVSRINFTADCVTSPLFCIDLIIKETPNMTRPLLHFTDFVERNLAILVTNGNRNHSIKRRKTKSLVHAVLRLISTEINLIGQPKKWFFFLLIRYFEMDSYKKLAIFLLLWVRGVYMGKYKYWSLFVFRCFELCKLDSFFRLLYNDLHVLVKTIRFLSLSERNFSWNIHKYFSTMIKKNT